ncbi:hypothetical protein RIF29_19243 [Crotalaria pallida]|uniref:Uncharacterized protein n=1 Tax=Crotalaria pallida TaxID=3830 RepID=A0AAN9EZ67_CROPI
MESAKPFSSLSSFFLFISSFPSLFPHSLLRPPSPESHRKIPPEKTTHFPLPISTVDFKVDHSHHCHFIQLSLFLFIPAPMPLKTQNS